MQRESRRGIIVFSITDAAAVRELVGRQPAARRRICELLLEGRSQTAIAEVLGVKRRTVTTHVARLRRAFREAGFDGVGRGTRRRRRRSSRTPRPRPEKSGPAQN